MKRTVLLSIFFLLLLGVTTFNKVQAQEGPKVGFVLSPLVSWGSITNDSTKAKPENLETKAAMGFAFNFVFTYGFSDNIGFKTGINIATKGIKSTTTLNPTIGGIGSLDSKLGITALEVPIGLKFRSPEIGTGMYIIGMFGVNAEINLQNKLVQDTIKVVVDTTTGTPTFSLAEDVERRDIDGINLFTLSFTPGVGLDWEFDWGMLEFAVTYHWGLLSYTTKKFSDPHQRTKMNAIALNIGYFF